jgi:hypothetical protein
MIPHGTNGRTIAVIVIACVLLLALVLATNGGLSGSATPTSQPTPPPAVTVPVKGNVTTRVHHISRHVWEYRYTIRDSGTSAIGGFQINGRRANLYAVSASPRWPVFGSGICHGKYPGVLVYWSTGGGAGPIEPGKTGHFSFRVETSGSRRLRYSLSFGSDAPFFGTVEGPAPSSRPARGSCR